MNATPYTYRVSTDRSAWYRHTTAKGQGWDLSRCTGPTDTSRPACLGGHYHESDGERCSHCFLNQNHTLDQHNAAIAAHVAREEEYERIKAYVARELAQMDTATATA